MRSGLAILIALISSCSPTPPERQYDLDTGQKEIRTKQQVDSVLGTFERVTYAQLPKSYKQYSDSGDVHRSILADKVYYAIRGKDIFKYLVGKFRVKDFLPRDKYYVDCLLVPSDSCTQYLLIDPKVLQATLGLLDELEARGLNRHGFTIRLAHRHPLFNKEEGGVKGSRHIRGQAIDIEIGDINGDGDITYDDKLLVLDIVENTVIRDKGGVGRYPHSMVVHYDTRGYKARWDKQKN